MKKLFTTLLFALLTFQIHAAAPMAKIAAPGFYRFMLGDFEITALSDGTVVLPMHTLMTNVSKEKVEKGLKDAFLAGPFETSVTAYLINTGAKLVLVDTGAAGLFGPTLGKLLLNLKASGYQPEQVDEVYITHLHNDHVGGLLFQDKIAFPNAIVRVDQHDVDFWLSPANMDKAPKEMKPFFQGPTNALAPYIKANKLKTFDGAIQLIDGVKSVDTRGHTPGHSIYLVESKGQKLAIIGDLIHVAALQFENPNITIQYDGDAKEAAVKRIKAFTDAATEGYIVAATHIPFPGLGHIRKNGKKFVWFPLNYTSL